MRTNQEVITIVRTNQEVITTVRTNQEVNKQNWCNYEEDDEEDVRHWVVEEVPFIEDKLKINFTNHLDHGLCDSMSRRDECSQFWGHTSHSLCNVL